jgi:hypothetical protein
MIVTHQKFYGSENCNTISKKTLQLLGGDTTEHVWFFYECISCTVAGGRLCCSHRFVGRKGFGGWNIGP